MARSWRMLASAALLVAAPAACAKERQAVDLRAEVSAPPTRTPFVVPSPAASAGPGAKELQDALGTLSVDRTIARTARAEAAAAFNAATGDDKGPARALATDKVKEACADLRKAYDAFEAAVRPIPFDASARPAVDHVLDVTGGLTAVLDRYAEATSPAEFAELNEEETVATAGWEEAVAVLAATVGTRGLAAAAPSGAPSPTGSPAS